MSRALSILLLGLACAIAGCDQAPTGISLTSQSGGETVLIGSSPGGNVDAFDRAFRAWSRIPGVKVEIHDWCASACTQILSHFSPHQICLSNGARLGFHSAVQTQNAFAPGAGLVLPQVDPIATLLVYAAYPVWIQRRLAAVNVMGTAPGNPSLVMNAGEFWHQGYGICPNPPTRQATNATSGIM